MMLTHEDYRALQYVSQSCNFKNKVHPLPSPLLSDEGGGGGAALDEMSKPGTACSEFSRNFAWSLASAL